MYKQHYGLTFNPFDKSAPIKTAFQSRDHIEMQNRLSFLKNTRGIGLFTAPPGMGKTHALRCFAEDLNPNLCQIATLAYQQSASQNFIASYAHNLG